MTRQAPEEIFENSERFTDIFKFLGTKVTDAVALVKYALTALDLQRAGLRVQREPTQVHVAHGGDSHSAGEGGITASQSNKT